jgi:phospholipase C
MSYRGSLLCFAAAMGLSVAGFIATSRADDSQGNHAERMNTATPIKHLVVIFQENVSFDHYFGTYPKAQNNPGETPFKAKGSTPKRINNLLTPLDVTNGFRPLRNVDLINNNPNANPNAPSDGPPFNSGKASNPTRLSPVQALTQDQGHNYKPEQQASDNGKMDGFPAFTDADGTPPNPLIAGLVMAYYDGNTVTALWNYAQHFALNDNNWTTTFGPSSPGAIALVSGQTNGFSDFAGTFSASHEVADGAKNFTLIGDADPLGDVCSTPTGDRVTMQGRNIGDLLNDKGITWGWFEGGFDLTITNPNGTSGCLRETDPTAAGKPEFTSTDYIPHHEPFQYYMSTRNTDHTRPSSVAAIGHSKIPGTDTAEPANHQYDMNDWFATLNAGNLPAVSFLKAPAFQDGHAGYSDPLDEQNFLVQVINAIQMRPEWRETAVVIEYDDSDGWYDHQMPPIVNPSASVADALNGPGVCNSGLQQGSPTPSTPLNGAGGTPVQGRCGYGTRLPLLVISPFARANHVDHTLVDQTSVLRFIEDNWLGGERIQPGGSFDTIAGPLDNMFDFDHRDDNRRLILNESTGVVVSATSGHDQDDDH